MNEATVTREELLRDALFVSGFDIFHGPFPPSIYNDLLDSEGLVEKGLLSKLPEKISNTVQEGTVSEYEVDAYLIGNTKHLWPIFLQWLYSENETKRQEMANNNANSEEISETKFTLLIEDPLDTYEQIAIKDAVYRLFGNENTHLYWSSDYDPSRMVSMARISHCTGFSYLDKHTHLSVHPTIGTWHSYRAVLLIPKENLSATRATSIKVLTNPLSALDQRSANEAFDRALAISTGKEIETLGDSSTDLCEEDNVIISEELGRGIYKNNGKQQKNRNDRKTRVASAWIQLREAISIGRENYRFDDNQLWYHYTKDPIYLFQGMTDLNLI